MDFYSELEDLVQQIPKGRVAFISDVAEALGDRAAAIALPRALERILPRFEASARVVKADGSFAVAQSGSILAGEGIALSHSRVLRPQNLAFSDFETSHPLRVLRRSQHQRAGRIVLRDVLKEPRVLAGVDAAYDVDHAYAAAVLLDAKSLETMEEAVIELDIDFPYIPGYLAFREMPAFLTALRAMQSKPDVLFVDGHGILHPAHCGIACFIGIETGLPTIGIGKSRLVGEIAKQLPDVGDASPVRLDGKIKGYAFRGSESKNMIYVSPGNRITPKTALEITRMACRHRIPEPIRLADMAAHREKMKNKKIVENAPVRQKRLHRT